MRLDHQINRASWNHLAAVHGQDAYYDTEALCGGASSLIEEEESALSDALGTDLSGKRILHLQCHLGFDAITFARRGARVTGVDFSSVALEKAHVLAARCGVTIEWICADAVDLPASLHGSFDLVWATIGVLCWIGDVSAWMREVSSVLRPGGILVLIDGVPPSTLAESTQSAPFGLRRVIDQGWDYATPTRTGPQVQYRHSLSAVLHSAQDAGLSVKRFVEHTSISTDLCISGLARGDDGRYRSQDETPQPILFTLIAEHPAGS
jgi:SAM-dependent methyltransferase